jgi:hypothetical protein
MALDKARGHRAFAYLMEMGTGKTKTLIDEIYSLWHSNNITAAVVLAPNGVHAQWEDQIEEHLHDSCPRDVHVWKKGKVGSKAVKALNLMSLDGRLKIISMNIEAIRGAGGKFLDEFLHIHKNALVAVDESSRIKNHRAQQTKAAISGQVQTDHVWHLDHAGRRGPVHSIQVPGPEDPGQIVLRFSGNLLQAIPDPRCADGCREDHRV